MKTMMSSIYLVRKIVSSFRRVYTRFCRRGSVRLSQERRIDEKYYDYYINVLPIFYAGNTKKEKNTFIRRYIRLKRSLDAFPIVKDTVKIKNLIVMVKRYYYYQMRKPDTYIRLMEHLMLYQDETKYVYVPGVNSKYNGVSTLRDLF